MPTTSEAVATLREASERLGAFAEREIPESLARRLMWLGDFESPLATRSAARLQESRFLVATNDRDVLTEASKALNRIAKVPIDLVDPLGRLVGAQARLEHALLAGKLGQRDAFHTALVALLREVERSALYLPADDVSNLVTKAAAYLDGKEWELELQRATEAAAERRAVELLHERLDDIFFADVREAVRSADRAPATRGYLSRTDGLVASEPDDPRRWFVRRRAAEKDRVLLLAPIQRRDGSLLGIAAFPYDVEGLVRRVAADRTARHADEATSFDVTTVATSDDDPETTLVPLPAPLDHVQVLARARIAEQDVLGAERTTMKLWLIALSIGGIAAGAVVTTRTVLREAKAAELKSDFVTNVTHELRTPLTSIRMFIETLELGRVEDEAEAKECLQIMGRETDRLTRLIERLLAFSKIESRKWRFKFSYTPPLELVNEAIRLLRRQLGIRDDAQIPIEVEAVQELPPVACDREAITEVLLNLLTNAWKYTPAENRRIRIVLSERRKQVVIDVEDNGIGVPRRDRRRIWKKFERGSNAEKGRVEGSGIGLTLALSIARGHGGTIALAPLKQGSRFSLILPKLGERQRAAVM
jgi:signal transduction histidine kinase